MSVDKRYEKHMGSLEDGSAFGDWAHPSHDYKMRLKTWADREKKHLRPGIGTDGGTLGSLGSCLQDP